MFAVRARVTAWLCFLIVLADVLLVQHCPNALAVLIGVGVLSALVGVERRSVLALLVCPFITMGLVAGIQRHIEERAVESLLNIQNKSCFAYGTICDTRVSSRGSLHYLLVDITRVLRPAGAVCRGRVLVSVPAVTGRPGDHVFLRGTIRGAKPTFYPWDYNESAFFRRFGIDGRFTLDSEARPLQVIPGDGDSRRKLERFFSELRTKIRDFHARANGQPIGDILTSIVIGSQAVDLEEDVKSEFRSLGLAHVLAASGFNIGVVVGVSYLVLRPLMHRRLLVKFFAFLVLLFYIGLTGMSASVQRAGLMWSVTLLVTGWNRTVHPISGLLFPLALTVLLDPWSPLDVGLQLSYAATAGLTLGFDKTKALLPERNIIVDAVASTVFAILSVLPLELQYFWQIGLLSIPANILVVPFIPLITLFGFVMSAAACVFPDTCPLWLLDRIPGAVLSLLMWVLKYLNTISWCRIIGGAPHPNCVAMYYVSILLLCTCRFGRLASAVVCAGFLISLCALFYKQPLPAPLVVITTEGALMIDEHRLGQMMTKTGVPDMRLDRAAAYLAVRSNGIAKRAEFVFPDGAGKDEAELYCNFWRLMWVNGNCRKEVQLTKDTYLFEVRGDKVARISPKQFSQQE